MKDAGELLGCPASTIYTLISKGKTPVVDLGAGLVRIDPKAWAQLIEKKNPHLASSAIAYQAA